MTGKTTGFGTSPVGSSVQLCPLGTIDVTVVRADGQAIGAPVSVTLLGPETVEGSVASDTGWLSPKILPGDYRVELVPATVPRGWLAPSSAGCRLPTSGTTSVKLVLEPAATLPLEVIRAGTTTGLADVTVTVTNATDSVDATTDADGVCRITDLAIGAAEVTVSLPAPLNGRYQPWTPRAVTLRPGTNPTLQLELAPEAEITVSVVDPDATSRSTVPATITLTSTATSETIELVSNPTTGRVLFAGLDPGTYDLAATPADDSDFTSASTSSVTIERGKSLSVELTAARARSRIVMSDKATRKEARGLLKNLIATPYPQARDEVAKAPIRNSTLLLPFTQLAFDDVLFEPDDAYWDDAKEVIAITGWAEAHGIRRQLLFTHTYRPNRLILSLKFDEWVFDRHWGVGLRGPLTKDLKVLGAFITLSASETSIKSADLPAGVASFFGAEDLDLKQGVNLFGSLDVAAFPALDRLLGWLDVEEKYLKLQGYLGHDADFSFSKEALEKSQVRENAWELALSASIPWLIRPFWRKIIKERQLTLEVAGSRTDKGVNNADHPNVARIRSQLGYQPDTAEQEREWKVHVKLEDEITVPLPTLVVPWLISVNEDQDVKFTGALQLEGAYHEFPESKKAKKASQAKGAEAPKQKASGTDGAVTLEYGTDFTIALFGKNLAVHDFKAEIDLSEGKLKLSGEIDLGRREKVAVVEFEREFAKPASTTKPPSGTVETGPSTPPKPSLDLEEKQNKPQPEAPTEEELSRPVEAGKPTEAKQKESPWEVTVKLKPSVAMGLFDIIRDIVSHVKSQQASP